MERCQHTSKLHNKSSIHSVYGRSCLLQLTTWRGKLWSWPSQISHLLWYIHDPRAGSTSSILQSSTLFCTVGSYRSRFDRQVSNGWYPFWANINKHCLKVFVRHSRLAHSPRMARAVIWSRSWSAKLVSPRITELFRSTVTSCPSTYHNFHAPSS